jgi:hypothetical protein
MSKIQDFASKLEAEVEALKSQYQDKLAELSKQEKKIKDRNAKSKSREIKVELALEEIASREADVNKKIKKIRSDEEMTARLEEAYAKEDLAKKLNTETKERLAEAKYREEEIAKKQLALQQEKGEYKAKLKQEFVDNLLKR